METRASLAFFATPGKLRMSPTSQTEQKLSRNEVARTPSWCKNIKVSFHSSLALLVNLQFGCSARHSYHVACNFKSKRKAPKDYGRIYFLKRSILYIYIKYQQIMAHFNGYGWVPWFQLERLRDSLARGNGKLRPNFHLWTSRCMLVGLSSVEK